MPLLYDVRHIFYLLCAVNVLVYVSRAIIPGAPVQFQAFIQESLAVSSANVSLYIGILVTVFVGAYCLFISLFGYLAMYRRPFCLAGACLFIWVVGMTLCGLAKPFNSFYVLLVGRLLSGIGESAFQVVVPTFIDEFAPLEKRTWWMGLFGCCMSAGTALGFSYGSLVAQTIGWQWAYYIAAALMIPLSYLCYFCIPDIYNMPLADSSEGESAFTLHEPPSRMQTSRPATTSILSDIWSIIKSPIFLTATVGWAAYAFSISGLAAFGPALLIGMGVLEEKICSTVFGGIVVVAGLLGSPLGGYLVDYQCRGRENESAVRHYVVSRQMVVMAIGATILALASILVVDVAWALLLIMFVALFMLFVTTSPFTVCILLSVNKARRSFAIGLSTFILHILGDLPAPLILGYLKDIWAPNCGSSIVNGKETLNPNCIKLDKSGLKWVLFFAYAWLGWTVLFWAITCFLSRRQLRQHSKLYLQFESSTPIVL